MHRQIRWFKPSLEPVQGRIDSAWPASKNAILTAKGIHDHRNHCCIARWSDEGFGVLIDIHSMDDHHIACGEDRDVSAASTLSCKRALPGAGVNATRVSRGVPNPPESATISP